MTIREGLFRIYGKLASVIAPTLKYSQEIYEHALKVRVRPDSVWLDLGCGHQLLPSWRASAEKELVGSCRTIFGLDYDLTSLSKHQTIASKVRGDMSHLPFRDSLFDLVTANMVIEHLDDPVQQFSEIHRVLRPHGLFMFHTPNIFGYTTIMGRLVPEFLKKRLVRIFEGREEEDVFRTYYRANSEREIRRLARLTGFRVAEIKMIVSSAQLVIIPPLVVFELLWLRLLMTKPFRHLRTNIIAVLQKN